MVFELVTNLNRKEKGITLIEVIVVIFVMAIFSTIIISDFPKIQDQFALSHAAYQLAQDIRKTQELSLSGVKVYDAEEELLSITGYGIYIDPFNSPDQYIVYADLLNENNNSSSSFDNPAARLCNQTTVVDKDCILEEISVSSSNKNVFIKEKIINSNNSFVSINFTPPNPTVSIDTLCQLTCDIADHSKIGIVLGLKSDTSASRTVWVNTAGLVNIR